MFRIALILLSVIAPLMFPWPLSLALLLLAALSFPAIALLGGVLMDVLYFAPGAALMPWGILAGIAGFVLATVMHDFMKTRIMGA
ncbi:MAG TPA: hypothetical protein VFY28_03410 [Candidatus Paceibacterota bacterium]|nr:hypothetical protein [Candidatus Paceibacterota bacterium]